MISGISPSVSVDSYLPYTQFNNNGYSIDENLNSVRNDRLQRVANQFSELSSNMGTNNMDAKFSINNELTSAQKKWYEDSSKKIGNGERFSTSTDDSDSSGLFKNGGDHSQAILDSKSDEDKPMPDHHARRPMNAFLIFCKRHLAIVRERYPNLENRAITKILGDWWANLDDTEKSSYTNLAKEYKDAFFNANPDFKWYKLPAPPLRAGCPRTNNDRHNSFSFEHEESGIDLDIRPAKVPKRNEGSSVSTFKLADEAQMGSLSSLMVASETTNGKCANNNDKFELNSMEIDVEKDDEKDGGVSENKDELHRVLGETHSFFQNTMKELDQPEEYRFESNSINNNIPRKSFHSHTSSSPEMKNCEFDSPDDDMTGYDSVFGPKKSTRACKGKRYAEFMNAQKSTIIGKRTKPRTASTSSSTSLSPTQSLHMRSFKKSLSCSQAVQKLDYDTFDHLYANNSSTIFSSTAAIKNETDANAVDKAKDEHAMLSPIDNRKFDVTEFELEQKINALHAHNLDEYLVRKQDTKKKKKVNEKRSGGGYRKVHKVAKSKAKTVAAKIVPALVASVIVEPKTIEEAKQRLAMVGSQKRKARKESITRRDVQQVTAIVRSFSPAINPQLMPVIAPFGNSVAANTNRVGNNGLLMLATMAEVAAANCAA